MTRTRTIARRAATFLAGVAVTFTVEANDASANGERARARRLYGEARKARRLADHLTRIATDGPR